MLTPHAGLGYSLPPGVPSPPPPEVVMVLLLLLLLLLFPLVLPVEG